MFEPAPFDLLLYSYRELELWIHSAFQAGFFSGLTVASLALLGLFFIIKLWAFLGASPARTELQIGGLASESKSPASLAPRRVCTLSTGIVVSVRS